MLYRGQITKIDFNKKEVRVWLPDFFDEGLNIYPIASLSYPIQGSDSVGQFSFLKESMWVWCMLEKSDPQLPVITGFIKEEQDFPFNHTEDTILSIINKQYGITFELDEDDNIIIKHDGDILLSTSSSSKNLLKQINDTNKGLTELQDIQKGIIDSVNTLINIYNTHVHPASLPVVGTVAGGATLTTVSNATMSKLYNKPSEDDFDTEFKRK